MNGSLLLFYFLIVNAIHELTLNWKLLSILNTLTSCLSHCCYLRVNCPYRSCIKSSVPSGDCIWGDLEPLWYETLVKWVTKAGHEVVALSPTSCPVLCFLSVLQCDQLASCLKYHAVTACFHICCLFDYVPLGLQTNDTFARHFCSTRKRT